MPKFSGNLGKITGIILILASASQMQSTIGKTDSETLTLPQIVRQTMSLHFAPETGRSLKGFADNLTVPPDFAKPAGVFVTLSYQGKPRACWGSLNPQYKNVVTATVYTTVAALSKDYRYRPISRSEYANLKPQVTVIRGLEPIHEISSVNPAKDGLLVRSGSKSGLILPGETRDAFYQLVKCKLKAGINPKEPFQMYRIKADVYK